MANDGDYRLGHGYDIGPFNLAGYISVIGSIPTTGTKTLELDDLSIFANGHVSSYINPFVEAELTHFDISGSSVAGAHREQGEIAVERLYNDINVNGSFTLRLGKMLAPVGEWNQIHAAPLVLTTVRPDVTYRNFSEYATGVSVLYSDATASYPDVQVYWQPDGEFSERSSRIAPHRYRSVIGAHVSFPAGLLDKIGVSFQHSKDMRGSKQSLLGIDFHYTVEGLTLEGEGTYSHNSKSNNTILRTNEWGAYAAASYALTDKWSIFGWYEGFTERTVAEATHNLLLGAAYRPHPAVAFKFEYLRNMDGPSVKPEGLYGSWSVLF